MTNNLELESQIQATHIATIGKIKDTLLAKAHQLVDFSNDKLLLDDQILAALNENGRQKLNSIQQQAQEEVLQAYTNIIEWMANNHLTSLQSEKIRFTSPTKITTKNGIN